MTDLTLNSKKELYANPQITRVFGRPSKQIKAVYYFSREQSSKWIQNFYYSASAHFAAAASEEAPARPGNFGV